MDWLTSSRPLKSVDFYQRKVVSFLFSAEGRDDFRCLNIPIAQLGFYSPLHFISCIPLEMCEPFKNDKLFLATSGELRKGDKVLLLEKGTEGIIRSAVFKGRRLGKSSEPEILLDGHRKTYTEEEVVPYKAHLRQQLGTSLVPEKEYDIRDGVLQWEEPSWEPGQEIYHTREKRWATILSHENNQRGRPVVLIKMEGTNLKKEKTIRISLQDLQEHAVPVRIPKRKIPAEDEPTLTSDSGSASLPSTPDVSISPPMVTDENEREVVEITHSPPTTISSSPTYAVVNKRPQGTKERQSNEQVGTGKVTYEKYYGSPVTPSKRFGVRTDSSESSPPPPLPTSPPPSKLQSLQRYETSPKLPEQEASPSLKPILRKKSSSTAKVRPATEYFPTSHPQTTATTKDTSHIYQDPDPLKFKSCNNLDLTVSDDDLEHFELVNYTNSLRSSARKIIQKQLANEVSNRATSLKLRPTNTRPHVAEIFTWDNDKMKMTKRLEPVSSQQPIYTRPVVTASPVTVSVHNNLSKCQSRSQPDIHRNDDQVDCSFNKTYSRPQSSMQHPYYQQSHKPNPLEFNFAPLSSSELVKKQLAVVNRVLEQQPPRYKLTTSEYKSSPSPASPFSKQRFNEVTGVSSDSSSPDNDSGRGSYQFIPETIKECDKRPTTIMNMCPVEKRHIEPNTNNSMTMNSENVNTSVNRRYTKNRSNSRSSSLPRHMSIKDDRDIVEEEVYNVPMPFNPGSIASVSGYGKGIQGTTNSSYADATLCALFACSNIFDMVLLYSKPGQVERGIKKEVRKILRDKIVTPLRLNAYCKSENVTHLREAMLPLSSKMHSPLMDAQEFLYLLFDSALNTESFIEFSNGTKDFMHQIIARPKDRSKSQTVQFMLETSLGISGLKFKQIPSPALFLCMPRCKGRLVYYEAIIPSLQLNVTRLLHEGTRRRPKQCVCEMAATLQCTLCHKKNGDMALDFCEICKGISDQIHFRLDHSPVLVPKSQKDELLNLHSIICTRGNRYVAFVKVTEHRLSPWLFFDSQVGEYPEVTLLEDFGRWLDSLEKQPGHFREFAKLHPLLKRIMTDSHIYIYSKAHLSYVPGQTESLVI